MKNYINPLLDKIHPTLWNLSYIAIPFIVFGWITTKPLTGFIRPISLSLRIDLWPIIPIAALIIYFLFLIPGRSGELFTVTGTMILFALPLAGLWAYGHTQSSILVGLLPLNDARGYYIDALRLNIGLPFSAFSSRRPLFAGFFAILLRITNYNLMISLAILTAITALAVYLTAREIQRTHGTETATFLLIFLFLYFRLHSGIGMSESIGVTLGCLGFLFLWCGAIQKKLIITCIGLFISTIALNARAGAFFMLPCLILWISWVFRENKMISWKAVFAGSIAVIIGFSIGLSLTRLIGNPSGIPFSNFSYTIYGLVSGGKSWSYIYDVHPEVFDLPEPEHTQEVYRLAIELIKNNPMQTVYGALFYWKSIFTDTLYHVFSYVASENWVIHPLVKWMLYILSIIGIYSCVKNINNPHNSLVVVAVLGVFLSVPFVPPIDSFRMRPYAASIVIIGILPAMGVAYLSKWRKHNDSATEDSIHRFPHQVIIFSFLLIMMMSIGPLALRRFTSIKELAFQPCPPQQPDIILTRFDKGTFVNIRKNTEEFPDWVPNLHAYIFQKYSHTMADQNFTNWIDALRPTQTLFIALDLISNSAVFIVVPTELLPRAEGYIQLCGNFEANQSLSAYHFYYASSLIPQNVEIK